MGGQVQRQCNVDVLLGHGIISRADCSFEQTAREMIARVGEFQNEINPLSQMPLAGQIFLLLKNI